MENRFKMKISSLFKSSFGSCKSKNISADIDNNKKPVFHTQNHQHYQLVDLFSPKPCPFPSMFRHKCPQNPLPSSGVRKNFLQAATSVYYHNSTLDTNGRKCPPASPNFPHDEYSQEKCNSKYYEKNSKKKNKKKKFKKMTNSKIKKFTNFDEEFANFHYKGLFSSDEESELDEDDNNTLFSSRSFTNSDSSEYSLRRKPRQRRAAKGGVKGSLAVVKKSKDPYGDFRDSMLEMIMENQIFGAKELENLLECFLKLNSQYHHEVIIDVFTEICEALFSSLS
ncbi:hypothetical protein H5410_059496 [Solanum commersonii]|uniref:Transcription repressor n=1 Tax=Solanum commersonii TaxID=4109 RepID=A0A9J5W2Q0_SOLCO|nr:hypothetical protein H5410_059496 [Solanum commersonii]